MQNLWVLILCFTFGFLLKTTKRIPENAPKTLNAFILYISLPAQILLYTRNISFSAEFLLPAGMAWILFLSIVTILFILKKFSLIDSKTFGCLVLTAGLGNTSFLGLPMIEIFFGKEFNSIGIICDQLGTFLILSLVGIPIALHQSSTSTEIHTVLKRILTFPPFLAFSLAFGLSGITFSPIVMSGLSRLGDTLAPLALFSVGFQFSPKRIGNRKKDLLMGLVLKMVLAPLIVYLLYFILLKNTSMASKISVFEAAMPPMITGGIVAADNDLAPELASMMIAMGVLVSVITLPIWKILLTI
ncbi:MAG: AEC family transporter [Leptospiraceae bacterium]|nr:AEC family transporter [Leptospiraceae bacterium]